VSPDGALIAVTWHPRETPLPAVAAVAVGSHSQALARRLLEYTEERLAALRGAATADAIVVLGPEDHLPWADGVVYLGREPAAPGLLVPTHSTPDVPIALLEAAVLRRIDGPPVAVVPEAGRLIAVGAARPIDRAVLAAWIAGR
jgi:hypothetical protein